jgi:TonB family protein
MAMKNNLIVLLFLLFVFRGYSQPFNYDVRGTYSKAIQQEDLLVVKSLSDLSPGYPTGWVSNYVSVDIETKVNGRAVKESGLNDQLNAKQLNIIRSADLFSEILITVKYKSPNPATDKIELNTLTRRTTVTPAIEASYPGGKETMNKYLEKNAMSKISDKSLDANTKGIVHFIINEKGEVTEPKLSQSSGDHSVDALILKAIQNMPTWKPAETASGKKVKQTFEFSIGKPGC